MWKDVEGNILLGTLAINQEAVKTSVLRQTLELFAKSLLESNPDSQKILLGMGGKNLSILFPNQFMDGGNGHSPLGKVRHEDNAFEKFPDELQTLEQITGMPPYGTVNLNNQDNIGMSPNNRLDMKNAVVFMDEQKALYVDVKASELLEQIHTKSAYREQKDRRTTEWQDIQQQGEKHRLDRFSEIEFHLLQQGVTDVKLEHSQGQDVTISTPRKPENLPYAVLDSQPNGDRFVTKLRVGGQRPQI